MNTKNISYLSKSLMSKFDMGIMKNKEVTFLKKNCIILKGAFEEKIQKNKMNMKNGIVFPIIDPFEGIVSFSIRNLNFKKGKNLKYYMFPFNKNFYLGGLNKTMKYILKEDKVFVVEGFFDLLAMYAKNIKNVVFICGSTLSQMQIALINSLTKNVVLAFDADEAGKKSQNISKKAFLQQLGICCEFLNLPDDYDPESFLNEHTKEDFLKAVV